MLTRGERRSRSVRHLYATLLVSSVGCGGTEESMSRADPLAEAQARVDRSCADIEGKTDALMVFISETDALELLLQTARQPAARDASLREQDAQDKYLEIKTWLSAAETTAPDAFTRKITWDGKAQTGVARLAEARRNLAALNVDALSKIVGGRRSYITQHVAAAQECLEAMKAHQQLMGPVAPQSGTSGTAPAR